MIDQALTDLDDAAAAGALRERLLAAPRRRTLEVQLGALEALDALERPRSVLAARIVLDLFRA